MHAGGICSFLDLRYCSRQYRSSTQLRTSRYRQAITAVAMILSRDNCYQGLLRLLPEKQGFSILSEQERSATSFPPQLR